MHFQFTMRSCPEVGGHIKGTTASINFVGHFTHIRGNQVWTNSGGSQIPVARAWNRVHSCVLMLSTATILSSYLFMLMFTLVWVIWCVYRHRGFIFDVICVPDGSFVIVTGCRLLVFNCKTHFYAFLPAKVICFCLQINLIQSRYFVLR